MKTAERDIQAVKYKPLYSKIYSLQQQTDEIYPDIWRRIFK